MASDAPAGQEQADHLAEHAQRSLGAKLAEEVADRLREAPRIDVARDLDAREGVRGIRGDVLARGLRRRRGPDRVARRRSSRASRWSWVAITRQASPVARPVPT